MAKKEEIKQLSPLEFTDPDGNRLSIFYPRSTIMKMDREHFTVQKMQELFDEEEITPYIRLVWYGLLASKPEATMEEAEELVFSVGLENIAEPVSELYMYGYNTLRNGEGKNAKWTMVAK